VAVRHKSFLDSFCSVSDTSCHTYIGAWSGQFPFEVNSASPGLVVTEWVNLSLVPEYVSVKGGDVITVVGKAFEAGYSSDNDRKSSYICIFRSNGTETDGFSIANVSSSQMLTCQVPPMVNPSSTYGTAFISFFLKRCLHSQCYSLNDPIQIVVTPHVMRVFSNGTDSSVLLVDNDYFGLKMEVSLINLVDYSDVNKFKCLLSHHSGLDINVSVEVIENLNAVSYALPVSVVSCNVLSRKEELRSIFAVGGAVMVSLIVPQFSSHKLITLQSTGSIIIHRDVNVLFPRSSILASHVSVTLSGRAIMNSRVWPHDSNCSFTALSGRIAGQSFLSDMVFSNSSSNFLICRLPSRLPPFSFFVSIVHKNTVIATSRGYNDALVFRVVPSILSIVPSGFASAGGSSFQIYGNSFDISGYLQYYVEFRTSQARMTVQLSVSTENVLAGVVDLWRFPAARASVFVFQNQSGGTVSNNEILVGSGSLFVTFQPSIISSSLNVDVNSSNASSFVALRMVTAGLLPSNQYVCEFNIGGLTITSDAMLTPSLIESSLLPLESSFVGSTIVGTTENTEVLIFAMEQPHSDEVSYTSSDWVLESLFFSVSEEFSPPPDSNSFILPQLGIDLGCRRSSDEINAFTPQIFKIPSGLLQKDSNYSDFDSPHIALCVVNSGDVDVALLSLVTFSNPETISIPVQSLDLGPLGGKVNEVTLVIPTNDRVALAPVKSARVSFTIESALSYGHEIRLMYPTGFFQSGIVGVSFLNNSTTVFAQSNQLSVPLTSNLDAGSYSFIISGLVLGAPTFGSANGIKIETSLDRISDGSPSGFIGGQVLGTEMIINDADRVPFSSGKTVTLSFATQTPLKENDFIFVNWTKDAFFGHVAPTLVYDGNRLTFRSVVELQGNSYIIRVDGNGAPANSYTLSLTGVALGAPCSAINLTVSSSRDRISDPVSSGTLGGHVQNVSFYISPAHRLTSSASQNNMVLLSFTTQTALSAQDNITLIYPNHFFAGGTAPVVQSSVLGLVASSPTETSLMFTATASIPAGALSMTLSGVTFGPPTAGSPTGILVSTSMDRLSDGSPSGSLGGQVFNVSFYISPAHRLTSSASQNNMVLLSFTTQTALSAQDNITLIYPNHFFAGGTAPVVQSSVLGLVASSPTETSLMFTATASIPAGALSMTLSGVTFGPPTAGSPTGILVSTSMDRLSDGSPSGSLGGQVFNVSVIMDDADRISLFVGKAFIFSFATSSHLLPGDQVFVRISGYDVNFTAARVIDSYPFGESLIFSSLSSSSSQLSVNVSSSAALAGRHTVTIVGCVVGSKSEGASVFISTSKDYENVGLASNISVVRMRAQHRMHIGVNISFFESFLSLSYSAGDTLAVVAYTLWNMSEATQLTDSDSPIAYPE
jgi:hypothetical protein